MAQLPIEELLKQCNSVYKLVVIAAKRAKELAEGAPKLIKTDLNLKKITGIALEEIRQGKLLYQPAEAEGAKGERGAAPSSTPAPARVRGGPGRQAGKAKERVQAGAKKKKA